MCLCVAERLTWWKCTEYLQFTVTSRAETPNKEFVAEILRAAGDLYALCLPGEIPKSRLIILSTNSDAERDTDWNYMRTSGAVIRRNQNAR